MRRNPRKPQRRGAFTLVELLVSMGVLSIIMLLLGSTLASLTGAWRNTNAYQTQFQGARAAFDSMVSRISSAELNPYWGYEYANGTARTPTKYTRLSNLHFVSGGAGSGNGSTPGLLADPTLNTPANYPGHAIFLHGAFGRTDDDLHQNFKSLLNVWGYYLEFGPDPDSASFLTSLGFPPRNRFRLMELQQPAEELSTLHRSSAIPSDPLNLDSAAGATAYQWFQTAVPNHSHPLAENIIALIIQPMGKDDGSATFNPDDLAPDYFYDSREAQQSVTSRGTQHRLPPLVRITLVALDETSAANLELQNGTSNPAASLGLPTLFKSAANYDTDLATLAQTLIDAQLDHRVFTTTVRLRNARWNEND